MQPKSINLIYSLLFCVAVILTVVFFCTWNITSHTKSMKIDGIELTRFKQFNVETCIITKDKLYISGWAFIPNIRDSIISVYAQKIDGSLLLIAKNSFFRKDISKKYGTDIMMYINSGFQASKRFLYKEFLTKKILIVVKPKESQQLYVAKYTCQ